MATPDQNIAYLQQKKSHTLLILDKITKLLLATRKGDDILYLIEDFFTKNTKLQNINLEEDKILDILTKIGLIKIIKIETDKPIRKNNKGKLLKIIEPASRTYQLEVDSVKLKDLYNNFEVKIVNKSSDIISKTREEIKLKSYGIKIDGRYISHLNEKKIKCFDPTEELLIYFLYFKFLNNPEECFKIEVLAKELKTTSGHLRNRIVKIHKILGKTVSINNPPKINFIKNEKPERGYHLNPKLIK